MSTLRIRLRKHFSTDASIKRAIQAGRIYVGCGKARLKDLDECYGAKVYIFDEKGGDKVYV